MSSLAAAQLFLPELPHIIMCSLALEFVLGFEFVVWLLGFFVGFFLGGVCVCLLFVLFSHVSLLKPSLNSMLIKLINVCSESV